MLLNEYQDLCRRTATCDDVFSGTQQSTPKANNHFLMVSLGIAGEAGEVADLTKKLFFHGHDFVKQKFILELGDVLWYVARMASLLGVSLEDVAKANVEKLRARYPNGFSEEASRNR